MDKRQRTKVLLAFLLCLSTTVGHAEEAILPDNTEAKQNALQEGATQEAPESVYIRTIVTTRSDILTPDELKAITGKYEGRSVSISELSQVVQEINSLYTKKQFVTSKAILQPQKITDGILKIDLVEGRIGKIIVEGNKTTSEEYIKDRIKLQSGEFIRLDALNEVIYRFNQTNDVRLQVELRAGELPGTTDCIFRIAEPEVTQTILFTDNSGRDTIGLYRVGLTYIHSSLTGNRDKLAITGLNSHGTTAGAFVYSQAIDTKGTRLSLTYDSNQVTMISGPLQSLDIQGDSSDIGLILNHPKIVNPDFKLELIAEGHKKKSATYFSGEPLLETKLKTLVIGAATQYNKENSVLYNRQDVTRGFVEGGKSFTKYNFYVVEQRAIKKDRLLTFRVNGQWTPMNNQPLPSSEQFSLGGSGTVRGYDEGFTSGNKGYLVSAELSFPTASAKIKGSAFIDHGGVYPYAGNWESGNTYLTGIGVGANIAFSPKTSGKMYIAAPLRGEDRSIHIHASVQFVL